jgi:uncharacterized protein (DUF433 family)
MTTGARRDGKVKQEGNLDMLYSEMFVRNPAICGGQPVIRGTRVTLRTVLASLAEGATVEEILDDFPSLTEQGIRAVIAFAAASATDDLPLPAVPVLS